MPLKVVLIFFFEKERKEQKTSLTTNETQKCFTKKKTASVLVILPALARNSFTSFTKITFFVELDKDVRKVRSQGLQQRRQSRLPWKPESRD